MSDKTLTLEKALEETGMIARWEARGEKKWKREGEQNIINLLKSGKSPEEIIREYEAK